jgi:hypothetical protein
MNSTARTILMMVVFTCLSTGLVLNVVKTQPKVRLRTRPHNVQEIHSGPVPQTVAVIAETDVTDRVLQYKWTFEGVGELKGKETQSAAILYLPPAIIEETGDVKIQVDVLDQDQVTATKTLTLKLVAPVPTPTPEPTVTPAPTPTPVPLRILTVVLQETEGVVKTPTYQLEANTTAVITTDLSYPTDHEVDVQYTSLLLGELEYEGGQAMYPVPNMPGGYDAITVTVTDTSDPQAQTVTRMIEVMILEPTQ